MNLNQLTEHLADTGYYLAHDLTVEFLPLVSDALGDIRVDPRSPEPFRRISPQNTDEANPNTLSSRYGMSEFPFHTDVAHWTNPARYLLLYCETPGIAKRPTLIQDSREWDLPKSVRSELTGAVWKTGHLRPQLCTVVTRDGALRYDRGCMAPLTTAAKELSAYLEELILGTQKAEIAWEAGMLLILDNRRMLHARGSAAIPDSDRVIIRALFGD